MRLQVLVRDGWRCQIVLDCPERASVADHIAPVSPEMPDAMFYGLANLRAGCRVHNIARGWAEQLETGPAAPTAVVTRDYSR